MIRPVFKRVVLKISGEALQGRLGYGIDYAVLASIARQIKDEPDRINIYLARDAANFWLAKRALAIQERKPFDPQQFFFNSLAYFQSIEGQDAFRQFPENEQKTLNDKLKQATRILQAIYEEKFKNIHSADQLHSR